MRGQYYIMNTDVLLSLEMLLEEELRTVCSFKSYRKALYKEAKYLLVSDDALVKSFLSLLKGRLAAI